jgi:site-specific recombinase XerD
VTHAEVQRWLTRLDLAPARVRKVHRVLSMVLAYAVKDGRLTINPAAGVSLPRVREAEKRFLSHQQVHELADACGGNYRLMVLFLAYTGLRWGEMAALTVGRVDFLRRRALVAESVTPVEGVMTFGPSAARYRFRGFSSMIWLAMLARGRMIWSSLVSGRCSAFGYVPAGRAD